MREWTNRIDRELMRWPLLYLVVIYALALGSTALFITVSAPLFPEVAEADMASGARIGLIVAAVMLPGFFARKFRRTPTRTEWLSGALFCAGLWTGFAWHFFGVAQPADLLRAAIILTGSFSLHLLMLSPWMVGLCLRGRIF